MQFYLAPMEGLTGYVYRQAYNKYFRPMDRYFTPFIANRGLSHREKQDILPEHNQGMNVVPQILANNSQVFLEIAEKLEASGYTEVNLNLGCPSGTVASKGKGAGFLKYPDRLDRFLEEIFSGCRVKISIKTRIGAQSPQEWPRLLDIYNAYPLTELIVHPRLLSDFYRNHPDMEAYRYAVENSRHSLCYNGDLREAEDFNNDLVKTAEKVMTGRGILRNPGLVTELCGGEKTDRERLKDFMLEILEGYCGEMPDDRSVLFKMKELWAYFGETAAAPKKLDKQLRKASSVSEYRQLLIMCLNEYEN